METSASFEARSAPWSYPTEETTKTSNTNRIWESAKLRSWCWDLDALEELLPVAGNWKECARSTANWQVWLGEQSPSEANNARGHLFTRTGCSSSRNIS